MTEEDISLSQQFTKIYREFIADTLSTFPEYKETVQNNENLMVFLDITSNTYDTSYILQHCKTQFLPHFFNIMYQNDEIFNNEGLEFIPGIDFSVLWKDTTITDKTRQVIWKYLQLILFQLVGYTKDTSSFGEESETLFKAIDEDTLKEKMNDVIENMKDLFSNTDETSISLEDISQNMNADELHSQIQSLMGGTLGSLAQEIAEETAREMDIDENTQSFEGVMKQLFKNPSKLMSLVKKIGSKLDTKMKSGEVNQEEMMTEAQDILKKMKDLGHRVPHMRQLKRMMNQMSSMDGYFKPNRSDEQKQRLKKKLEERKNKQTVYQRGEKPEQSMINDDKKERNIKRKQQRRNRKKRNRK